METTFNENGVALTETYEGVTMPADYSFEVVNDFVHGVDVQFEELQALCLGMATTIEQLREQLAEAHRDLSSREYECTALREAIDRLKEQSVVAVAYAKDGILDDDGWAQICGTKFRKYCVPLYAHPPAETVPRRVSSDEVSVASIFSDISPNETECEWIAYGWNACREAMLSAQGEK